MIYVCNLIEMPTHAAVLEPSHLISLVPPEEQPATPLGIPPDRHLRIEIHDISEPLAGCILPEEHHIARVVDFVEGWTERRPILIHCVAGVSRSMAAALITLVVKGSRSELAAARHVRTAAPHAQPNGRMITIADRLLGCEGRLVAARQAMGPASWVITGPLVRLIPSSLIPA